MLTPLRVEVFNSYIDYAINDYLLFDLQPLIVRSSLLKLRESLEIVTSGDTKILLRELAINVYTCD